MKLLQICLVKIKKNNKNILIFGGKKMYLSFDIGGTNIKFGVVNEKGQILEKAKVPTPKEEVEFLSLLTKITDDFKARYSLDGIGISAPGVVSSDGVMTTFGALQSMYGLPLREKLSGLTQLPVVVENDANAAAIAEHCWWSKRPSKLYYSRYWYRNWWGNCAKWSSLSRGTWLSW